MLFRKYLAAGMLLFLAGCMATGKLPKNATDAEMYQYAITEAMSPNPSKVYNELVPVTQQNPDLSWKNFNGEDLNLFPPTFGLNFVNNVKYKNKK